MDVALVRWPDDESQRRELKAANRPRLLLVDETAPAPVSGDPLEDWIRLPADDRDLRARLDALTLRAGPQTDVVPEIDDDGLLHVGDQWVSLPPIEHRLALALLDKPSTVVSREVLAREGWPGETATRNALDVHMLRLRRRIEPLGLTIRTVRSRGYVLDVVPSASHHTSVRNLSVERRS
jgi:DNA-binding winged helix-turn-helix (wHTH) protein